MNDTHWPSLWQQAQSDPYTYGVLTLMALNGLSISTLKAFAAATIDPDYAWLTTQDGSTYPLVTQSANALRALEALGSYAAHEQWTQACNHLSPVEAEAQRRLAGALWVTHEETQLILTMTSAPEVPILPLRFTFPFSIVERLQAGESSAIAQQARHTLQTAADWLIAQSLPTQVPLPKRVLGLLRQGNLVFLVASTGVSGLNLIHNVLMGRLLSLGDYSQLTFIITLQLLIGLAPTSLQTVTARFSARYAAQDDAGLLKALHHAMRRFGWIIGLGLAVGVFVLAPVLTQVFALKGFGLLLPVALAVPFFVTMGADRGLLQGGSAYLWLSGAYLVEGLIRLMIGAFLGYALVNAGRSLEGAVWGLAQSMLATWFISWLAARHFRPAPAAAPDSSRERARWTQLGGITLLALIGQALITNSDFLLVKNFFSPEDAGLYAAVSVLGRIVYFGALPLTILLVPLVARRQALDEPTRPILFLLVGGGTAVCGVLIVGAAIFAGTILQLLYGSAYESAAGLLAPYALAASLYTLTNLVITYQIALGSGRETWMPILAGLAQVGAIIAFHRSLPQVITIQIALMGLLFSVVLGRVLRSTAPRADLAVSGLTADLP